MSAGAQSEAWFSRAQAALPGGVDSPVRAFGAVGGTPIVIQSAKAQTIVDVDGFEYLDFVGSWGPLILGHAHREVVAAIEAAVRRGTSYGAPCPAEIELAEQVVQSYPGIEQVRFVSSGTEAVMSAVRLARGATGRDFIVKFSGCYHGHVDHLLVAAGSGLVTLGEPSSAGVPADFAALTRILPLDDEAALDELFAADGKRIAAVIIEPVPANNGLLIQRSEFLSAVRERCDRHGSLLIFDEVISGFRLGPGGAAAHYGLVPDLATFGKVIGGGMPVGAFAGSRALMRELAPEGSVYQAGTLSGNPVAMTAGLATLGVLREADGWHRLEELGRHLEQVLGEALRESPCRASLARLGSIFWIALFASTPPRAAEAVAPASGEAYASIFHSLLAQGIALAPSAYEVGFLSLAHTTADVDRLGEGLSAALCNVNHGALAND
ncbi:glutamate-1-semialdehyde 2,1-aminomutase [Candidatus Rariloculus sp.]|uniref:glutamate-1-semialdehyde 2,1-aminomutase n=1 Tax=Candidatus Rariloculus sp. TaxID=3101265 RepID=UPI003D11963E